MPFRPVITPTDLPTIGARREDLNFDFKREILKATQEELAKDVAAFANASGGTILVGADENFSTNALSGWFPLSETDAAGVKTAYENAVRNRCSPPPVIDVQVIPWTAEKYVVAVNVWPYPLLPVGVRVNPDKTVAGKKWDAWIVFVRVGTGTKAFLPEQAAMLMIPTVRHALMLLDGIPSNRRAGITTFFRMPQMVQDSQIRKRAHLDLLEVRPLENAAVFRGAQIQKPNTYKVPAGIFHVPLNEVEAVWSLQDGTWCLKLKGQIQAVDGKPFYVPNE